MSNYQQINNYFTYAIIVTREEYCKMLLDAHFGSGDMEIYCEAWDEMYKDAKKEAGKCVDYVKIKVTIWYKKANLLTVILSLGDFYDAWIDRFEKRGELLKAYAVENYALALMRKAYGVFGKEIYAREGKYPGELQFFDEEQMQTVPDLLAELNVKEVQCNEAFAMIPQKTVVFSTELSSEKQADCDDICAKCDRVNCPNRQKAGRLDEKVENYQNKSILNYGYRQILSNKENDLWKKV